MDWNMFVLELLWKGCIAETVISQQTAAVVLMLVDCTAVVVVLLAAAVQLAVDIAAVLVEPGIVGIEQQQVALVVAAGTAFWIWQLTAETSDIY